MDCYELVNGCQGGAHLMDVEAREALHEGVCHKKCQLMFSVEEKGEGEIPGMLNIGMCWVQLRVVMYPLKGVLRIPTSHSKFRRIRNTH